MTTLIIKTHGTFTRQSVVNEIHSNSVPLWFRYPPQTISKQDTFIFEKVTLAAFSVRRRNKRVFRFAYILIRHFKSKMCLAFRVCIPRKTPALHVSPPTRAWRRSRIRIEQHGCLDSAKYHGGSSRNSVAW